MPLYDFRCNKCGKEIEVLSKVGETPICCGEPMERLYRWGDTLVKWKYPMWVDRIDEIHKKQADKGERLRYVHPKEVGADRQAKPSDG